LSLGCLGDLSCQDGSRLWIHDTNQTTLYWSYELLCTLPPLPRCNLGQNRHVSSVRKDVDVSIPKLDR
jgi:hypothetical protein